MIEDKSKKIRVKKMSQIRNVADISVPFSQSQKIFVVNAFGRKTIYEPFYTIHGLLAIGFVQLSSDYNTARLNGQLLHESFRYVVWSVICRLNFRL